tara:strand:+ start:756 stop:2027 length:1272 start_codon:yes stop_codon:yes gene_type:complete
MHFWYKLLTYLFQPFSFIYLFTRKLKNKEHQERYIEKISRIKIKRENGYLVWVHAASVGEAMSVLPLIENFENNEKIKKILITTITLSSAQILQKRYLQSKKIIHQFLPLDVPKFVNKFLNHWNPNLAIFIDSEIWPNLIFSVKKKNVPLLLINGRITKKTFLRWKIFKKFSKNIFKKFDLCLAASKESEEYLKILGAQNVKNYGNLKFAKTKNILNKKLNSNFFDKIKKRYIWCAASTHPTEEIFCAQTHLKLKKTLKNILTVIIPRHINRVEKISDDLNKLGLKVVLHSNYQQIDEDTDILLVDAYGETAKFYNISRCVFIGKSLIDSLKKVGGQNPIEPSRLGCKIFHGPNVSNFSEIYEYLKSLNVAKEIRSSDELNKLLVEELEKEEMDKSLIIEKIENYGLNTLNNVIEEIKIYINK